MENNISENFYSRLQKTLEGRGLTLADLASRTGIALSTMYRWKDSEPQTRTVRQIANALDVPVMTFTGMADTGKSEAFANGVREEPALYQVGPKARLTPEDIARLLHYDLDAIVRTSGDEQRRNYLLLRDVHLPSLGKLLNIE